MRRPFLLVCCVLAMLRSVAFGQAPDVGVLFTIVDPGNYYTSTFNYNFEPGQQIVLRVCYGNAGLGAASGMNYSVSLPAGLSNVAVTSNQAQSTQGNYNSGTGVLTVNNLPDPLPAGARLCAPDPYSMFFSRTIVSFTAPGFNFDAIPTVTTTTAQSPNNLPDSITGHFFVSAGPPTLTDLSTLVEGPLPVPPGVPVQYKFHVQNLGPREASNVLPAVQLPVGTTGVSVAGGNYDPAGGVVTWPALPTLAVGGQSLFTFSILNPSFAQGIATVRADNAESNYLNNSSAFNLIPALSIDVDGNGSYDALTDGLILIRYLFGLRGDSLISGAIGPNATRTTAAQIEAYLLLLMP
jgi:hypothetical protein